MNASPAPDQEPAARGDVVLYRTEDGTLSLEVNVRKDTVWLSLGQMADLFGRDKSVVSRHIRNIFTEGEHEQEMTVTKFTTMRQEGSRQIERVTQFYNLDVIVSVGYRVKSERGRQFRQWASSVLRDHVLDGYTINPRRLASLEDVKSLPAPDAQVTPRVSLAARRTALQSDPARAAAQLAIDLLQPSPASEEAVQAAAAVLQMAAHLLNRDLAANDDELLGLARMLARAGSDELDDKFSAVAAALAGPQKAAQ
jgi:hypothetical protein